MSFSNNGPLTPYHYVNFKFSVSENIFNVELRDKQDLFDKCNAVLTLFLGVMAIMHTMKLIVEKGLCEFCGCCIFLMIIRIVNGVFESNKPSAPAPSINILNNRHIPSINSPVFRLRVLKPASPTKFSNESD